jgi:predicted lipoprotein with Yx(FWY)xxD motif
VVPEKRKLTVVGGAIAAAFLLPGCAPAGYNAADYNGGAPAQQPAANEVAAAPSEPAQAQDAPKDEAPNLSEDEVTSKLVAKSIPRMGQAVVDQDGWVLYRFDKDTVDPVASNCDGDCAKIWPPAVINEGEEPELDGVSSDNVGTVKRKDGTLQLTIGDWPVYRYIGDKKPGQWKGQNVGGTWFVVKPDGKKNLTCLPPVSKPVAPPAGDDKSDSGSDSGSGGSGSDYNY